jgi:hypothetical protein
VILAISQSLHKIGHCRRFTGLTGERLCVRRLIALMSDSSVAATASVVHAASAAAARRSDLNAMVSARNEGEARNPSKLEFAAPTSGT